LTHPPFSIPRPTNAAQPQAQQQQSGTVGYLGRIAHSRHSNPIAEGARRVATASCGGLMDQSYHGGAAAAAAGGSDGQMWVRGTRVVCVRHSVSFRACLVLRLLLIRVLRGLGGGLGCLVLGRADAPLSDDTRPRAGLPAGRFWRLLVAHVADLTVEPFFFKKNTTVEKS